MYTALAAMRPAQYGYVPLAGGQGFGTAAQAAEMLERSGLQPIIDQFPGASLMEKLASGRLAARETLLKYTSKLTYDPLAAEDLLNEIQTWQDRHAALINEMMSDPRSDTLPEQVALKFGPDKARQFVVAGYAEAARGLGPWLSGDIARNFRTDPTIPEDWVKHDAEQRLVVFASVLKMESDGDLLKIFRPDEYANLHPPTAGLGTLPALVVAAGAKFVIVALALVFVATVAVFLIFIHSMKDMSENNRMLEDRCKAAEQRIKAGKGTDDDKSLVRLCIEGILEVKKEKAKGGGGGALAAIGDDIVKYVFLAGLAYTAVFILLPRITEQMGKKKLGVS